MMISVITADVIQSRKHSDPDKWIHPLKNLLSDMAKTPEDWIIFRGDSFQLRLDNPLDSFKAALLIKTWLYSTSRTSIRLAIGIGPTDDRKRSIDESNGLAYQKSGNLLDQMKMEKTDLAIASLWDEFDKEWSVLNGLCRIIIHSWSVAANEIVYASLKYPDWSQEELARSLKISQASVSGRLKRAHFKEISDLERWFRYTLQKQLDA